MLFNLLASSDCSTGQGTAPYNLFISESAEAEVFQFHPPHKKSKMDLVALSNNGGVSAPQAPQFQARVTNSGCNTGCCGCHHRTMWITDARLRKSRVETRLTPRRPQNRKGVFETFACVRPRWR